MVISIPFFNLRQDLIQSGLVKDDLELLIFLPLPPGTETVGMHHDARFHAVLGEHCHLSYFCQSLRARATAGVCHLLIYLPS